MSLSKFDNDASSGKSNMGKIVAGAVAALAVGGAAYYFLSARKSEMPDSELDFGSPTNTASASASASSSSAAAVKKPAASASSGAAAASASAKPTDSIGAGMGGSASSSSGNLQSEQSLFAQNSSFGGDAMYRENTDAAVIPGRPNEQGQVQFPKLNLVLQLAPRWQVSEDHHSPAPTAAIVQFMHEDYMDMDPQQSMPGDVPVVICMVEDCSADGTTPEEQKDKTRDALMGQLHMMVQGQMRPQLTKDAPADVGPFKHVLEITMRHPFIEVETVVYTTMIDRMAYTFQFMAKPAIVKKLRADFASMARQVQIMQQPASASFEYDSFLWMPLRNKSEGGDENSAIAAAPTGSFRMPTSWQVAKLECRVPKAILARDTILAEVQTASSTKPEYVAIVNKKPKMDLEGIEIVEERDGTESAHADTLAGCKYWLVKTQAAHDSAKFIKVFQNPSGDFWLVSGPTAKHNQVADNELFANVVSSAQVGSSAPTKTGVRFHSPKHGIAFDVKPGARIVESRFGENMIMYAPLGQMDISPNTPPTPELIQKIREAPAVSIRVGDPTDEEDCKSCLEEWEKSLKKDRLEMNIKTIEYMTVEGNDGEARRFLCFSSEEMVDVGMGQKEDRAARMFITMKEERSVLVKWEAPMAIIRKYETMINEMLKSLDLF